MLLNICNRYICNDFRFDDSVSDACRLRLDIGGIIYNKTCHLSMRHHLLFFYFNIKKLHFKPLQLKLMPQCRKQLMFFFLEHWLCIVSRFKWSRNELVCFTSIAQIWHISAHASKKDKTGGWISILYTNIYRSMYLSYVTDCFGCRYHFIVYHYSYFSF